MSGSKKKYSIHSLCRICLDTMRVENAFDLFLVPGLAKKLCVCTSLTVEPQDGFPKNICGGCFSKLNDLHDFQQQCVESVQKFQEIVAKNIYSHKPFTMLDANVPVDDEGDMQEVEDDDDERLNFDPLLNHKLELIENEDDVFKMLEHVDKEVEETENRFKEEEEKERMKMKPISEKKFFSSDSSSESEVFGGRDDDDDDFKPEKEPEATDTDDDKPLGQFLRKTRRRKVKKSFDDDDDDIDDDDDDDEDGDNDFNQPLPKPKRKRIPEAERHLHRIIDCHICHQKFKKSERYQDHMKYHNDKLPHQCTVETCRKGFTTANALRVHVEHCHTNIPIESLPCPEEGCGRTFPRVRSLNWHLRKAHNIVKKVNASKSYPCSECEKVFRCSMALKKHMYKHDGKELPFPCNICGKRFVINSELKNHLMRHAGIKNYVCPYCGIGKTTRQEWNTHINTHTQEKKFQCSLCSHSSQSKHNLGMHIKVVHEKIKDYACQYCGKTFGKSSACKMHEMTHTGEKRCECKVCGKRFLYANSLTKHLKMHEKRLSSAIEVYRKRQIENGELSASQTTTMPETENPSKETYRQVAEEIQKVCAESAASIPKDPRRVERVDITQLAGTAVNPIPSVAVASWSPQIKFVMKEGPYVCPDCGQGFNGAGNLKRHHRIVHERIKDFACRFCDGRFAKPDTLKHHEMTHTGEKPFECKVCNKRFIQNVTLKRHMKVHLKTRPPPAPVKPKSLSAARNVRKNRPPPAPVDPANVHVAREELQLQEREKLEAKRKAEKERAVIAEVAKEQLTIIQQQEAEKPKYELTINASLVPDPRIRNFPHIDTSNPA